MKFNRFMKVVQSHAATSWATGGNPNAGNEIDCLGFEEAIVILNAGVANTAADVAVKDCATSGGSFGAISGAVFTQITTSNDVATYYGRIDLTKCKRYLKIEATVTGTAALAGIDVILLAPKLGPADAPQWAV
jgi:hypothetical protein